MRIVSFLAVAALSLLGGCASVSVRDVNQERADGGRPVQIYVAPFDVNQRGVKENRARKNPGQLGAEAQQLLANYLVGELRKMGVSASLANTGANVPRGSWLVSGTITRLAEGNRLLRMGIGLGAGGTKMETDVQVRTPGRTLLSFQTTGGSNATPGGATNPVPFSGVPTALLNAKEGVTDDSARTARMIAGTIGEYMAERGWVAREKIPVVKRAKTSSGRR